MATVLPRYLKRYFWDTPFSALDSQKHKVFLIERILNMGDLQAVQFLFKRFRRSTIKKVLATSRNVSHKSANFWALFLEMPRKEVLCLTPAFRRKQRAIWQR